MKKFRGQKRYYKQLESRVESFELDLNKDSWYNMWHTHFDWPGYSNLSWKHRHSHLIALKKVFDKSLQQLEGYQEPYQIFLFIDYYDGSADAIYFHTPNPYSNFPIKLEGIEWNVKPPQILKDLMDSKDLKIGFNLNESQKYYYVCSTKHGIDLE